MKELLSPLLKFFRDILFPGKNSYSLPESYDEFKRDFPFVPNTKDSVTFFLSYRNPSVKNILEEIKRYRNKDLFSYLGRSLAEEIQKRYRNTDSPITLIPIPQTTSRTRERGYHVTSLLVQATLNHLPQKNFIDGSGVLGHNRKTHQSGLGSREERISHSSGMFSLEGKPLGTQVIIIDDVFTTGASLAEAKKVLKESGAEVIDLLTLAH